MKLSEGTQRSFYRAIKARRQRPERIKTTIMLDRTRHAARDLSGNTPTDAEIWQSICNPDISRTTRDFLWRCMHQAYKVGDHWRNIPTYEHWAICQHCQVDETMEHILVECEAPGREQLWNLARKLWEMKGLQWPEINMGRIFACGLADIENAQGRRDKAASRLYRIVISETAHQIWNLRCKRVIERGSDPSKYFSEAELHNKWLHCINSRLRIEILLTDSKKFGSRTLNLKRVKDTWKGVIKDVENLMDTEIRQSGFLVGIAPLRPPGRNQ
ncbi:hypothetical protein B0H19DRAFT_1218947 [Mycena capillaripes]|nr:hypothetical protein B0H19DRAFT_1218947 [Mycena capillaripes]